MGNDFHTQEDMDLYMGQKFAERVHLSRRPTCKWQLPAISNLSISQCHEFLRDRLTKPSSDRETDLRARLLIYFSTWREKDDAAIFVIARYLDELLFGEIIGKHTEYARLPIEDAHGFSQMRSAPEGFNHLVTIALNIRARPTAKMDGYKPRTTAAILWGTLIHEMLHAFTMIATGEHRFIQEVCKCGSVVDHGPMWAETIGSLVTRLDIGITAEDMTNRLEICHEPDHRAPDIAQYQGVLKTDGRRYSESQSKFVELNYTHMRSVETEPVVMLTKADEEKYEEGKKARQRRDTWPPRTRRMSNGTSVLTYNG